MQPAPIKEPIAGNGGFAAQVWIRWLQLVSQVLGYSIAESIRITSADSPYSVATGVNLVCNTDGGAITVLFPAGVNGAPIRVANSGTSGNDVTLNGNGETIAGAATRVLADGVAYECRFDAVDGWN